MTVVSNTVDDKLVCAVKGALTIWEAAAAWQHILPLLAASEPVTIDLSEVSECDGAGIQMICQIQQAAAGAQKKIRISDPSEPVLTTMQQAGMDTKPFSRTVEET